MSRRTVRLSVVQSIVKLIYELRESTNIDSNVDRNLFLVKRYHNAWPELNTLAQLWATVWPQRVIGALPEMIRTAGGGVWSLLVLDSGFYSRHLVLRCLVLSPWKW